jgi:hypothetical protein
MTSTWADQLGAACEAMLVGSDDHPARAWVEDRGVPAVSGVGLGVWPELDYPEAFVKWALRVTWTSACILIIRDWSGRVVGFQARSIHVKGYETFAVYDNTVCPLLWGADRAAETVWTSRRLVLVEGAFDALACYLAGGTDIIATLTAKPSKAASRWIARLADTIICLYDMDAPGREGVEKVRKQFPTKVVTAPRYAAHDPWDCWKTHPQYLAILKPLTAK